MSKIEELVYNIKEANEAYRTGEAIVSDVIYDSWVDELTELDPFNDILSDIGLIPMDDSRKQKLKIPMASMNKLKTIKEIQSWVNNKNINSDVEFVLSPKLDGCALCNDESNGDAYTRGDGTHGQKSNTHLSKTGHKINGSNVYTFGEVIIKKNTFLDKYSDNYANGRNFVAGLLNSSEPKEHLTDCDYIRYGLVSFDDNVKFNYKTDIFDYLNKTQTVQFPYKTTKINELTIENLTELYKEWCVDYEIDGIIIEINDLSYINSLGREKNGNPSYARAIKLDMAERAQSTVLELEYNISKNGDCIPRVRISPVQLDGVEIQWITCNNARYVKDMGIGTGSDENPCIIELVRSGGVIPLITRVVQQVPFIEPELGHELEWDSNSVHLRTVEKTDSQRLQEIISFFNILDVDAVKEGVITQLFESGYDTVKKILSMTKNDFLNLDRFGEKKAESVYSNIHSKMKDITLSKLQHASNKFTNLGSKKLLLLESLKNPTMNEICSIEGFSDISARNYLDGIGEFNYFLEDLGDLVRIKKTEMIEPSSDELVGKSFVFSGYRDKEVENNIKNLGGEIKSGISKNVTHLVVKDKQSGSSKIVKAEKLGIDILDVNELMELLN